MECRRIFFYENTRLNPSYTTLHFYFIHLWTWSITIGQCMCAALVPNPNIKLMAIFNFPSRYKTMYEKDVFYRLLPLKF